METSNHANIRGQQRGIPLSEMEMILNYATPKEVIGNALAYEVQGKTKNMLIARLKHLIQQVEDLTGKVVIESDDGKVITAYHKKGGKS